MVRRDPPDAIFHRIAADLRARIDRGEFPVGVTIGTEKVLAQHYDVGVWAIGAAVEVLRAQGVLEPATRGRSAIVAERPDFAEIVGRRGSTVEGRPATEADVALAPPEEHVHLGTQVFVVRFGVEVFVYRQDRRRLRFN